MGLHKNHGSLEGTPNAFFEKKGAEHYKVEANSRSSSFIEKWRTIRLQITPTVMFIRLKMCPSYKRFSGQKYLPEDIFKEIFM